MCGKDERIIELQSELTQSHQRKTALLKTIVDGKKLEHQIYWRPWRVALIPVVIAVASGVVAIVIAITKW